MNEYDGWYFKQQTPSETEEKLYPADHLPETRLPPRVEGFEFVEAVGRVWEEAPGPEQSDVEAILENLVAGEDDSVMHPSHYARWEMEPIEFIAINDLPWWLANVIKYTMRYDAKDGLQDLYKARSYLEMKIRQLEGETRFWDKPVTEERKLNDISKEAA